MMKKFIKYIWGEFFNIFYLIPFINKPYPKEPFGNIPLGNKEIYLKLWKSTIEKKYPLIDQFEKEYGFSIGKKWFSNLCLFTQTCIKKSELNFNHGRILYSLLSNYISKNKKDLEESNFTILETGTARGFSAICMSKVLIDQKVKGKIISLDCISHTQKMYWNCISDIGGKTSREELLLNWEQELKNIIFIQGWSKEILKRIGLNRINFAFLDAQHTKKAVMEEFKYILRLQKKGDIIFFDDVTPILFDGVCKALEEIENNFPYSVERLSFSKKRGYAIAIRI